MSEGKKKHTFLFYVTPFVANIRTDEATGYPMKISVKLSLGLNPPKETEIGRLIPGMPLCKERFCFSYQPGDKLLIEVMLHEVEGQGAVSKRIGMCEIECLHPGEHDRYLHEWVPLFEGDQRVGCIVLYQSMMKPQMKNLASTGDYKVRSHGKKHGSGRKKGNYQDQEDLGYQHDQIFGASFPGNMGMGMGMGMNMGVGVPFYSQGQFSSPYGNYMGYDPYAWSEFMMGSPGCCYVGTGDYYGQSSPYGMQSYFPFPPNVSPQTTSGMRHSQGATGRDSLTGKEVYEGKEQVTGSLETGTSGFTGATNQSSRHGYDYIYPWDYANTYVKTVAPRFQGHRSGYQTQQQQQQHQYHQQHYYHGSPPYYQQSQTSSRGTKTHWTPSASPRKHRSYPSYHNKQQFRRQPKEQDHDHDHDVNSGSNLAGEATVHSESESPQKVGEDPNAEK